MSDQPVFAALADPVRRSLLIGLAENGPRTATQFAAQYPITRQGILKHLNTLEEVGLVSVHKTGREQRYELRREPLVEVDDFIKSIGHKLDERLLRLKTMLEDE